MLLHKTAQVSGNKAVGTRQFTPSRGPVGSFEQIGKRLYFRRLQGGLRRVPEPMNGYMVNQLEHRNKIVRKVRWSLGLLAMMGLLLVTYLLS